MIQTQITTTGGPKHCKAHFNEALSEAMEAAIEHWHAKIFPGHFNRSAHAKYGYQKRSLGWIKRKQKKTGQAIDLVGLSGDLKRQTSRSIKVSSNKTGKHAKGVLTGPRYLYMLRKNAKEPDKAAELLATVQPEAEALARLVDEQTTRKLSELRERDTVRV